MIGQRGGLVQAARPEPARVSARDIIAMVVATITVGIIDPVQLAVWNALFRTGCTWYRICEQQERANDGQEVGL